MRIKPWLWWGVLGFAFSAAVVADVEVDIEKIKSNVQEVADVADFADICADEIAEKGEAAFDHSRDCFEAKHAILESPEFMGKVDRIALHFDDIGAAVRDGELELPQSKRDELEEQFAKFNDAWARIQVFLNKAPDHIR